MAKFNQEDGKSYTEFFAFRFTRASDIDDIADSDIIGKVNGEK